MQKIFKENSGTVLVLTLIMSFVFVVAAVAIASYAIAQHKLSNQKVSWHQSLNIAEAGLNYYRWHLAHAPEDYYDGTGEAGTYTHEYHDPQGGLMGWFELVITPPSPCSNRLSIESKAYSVKNPETDRVLEVKYGQPSLANFSFITNSDVWFGSEENLEGPVHSNGGIRQDGWNNSVMYSAKETYTCQPHHGCSSPGETKPGIWGSGGDDDLWEYPTSNIDFDMLTVDLSELKSLAETYGLFLGNKGLGYRLNFKSDGTVDIYEVKKLERNVWYQDMDGNHERGSWDIDRQNYSQSYSLGSECDIIFVEDDVWVDGVVNGRASVVAAKLPEVPNNQRTIVINGNLTYLEKNRENSLGLIAQKDIIVPLYGAPDNLEINAVMLAQKGSVYRPYYEWYYWPYYIRNSITTYGTIISNKTWTWSWVDGWGSTSSGYENTETIYDPNLNYNPPPGFPTYGDYKFLEWQETTEKQ